MGLPEERKITGCCDPAIPERHFCAYRLPHPSRCAREWPASCVPPASPTSSRRLRPAAGARHRDERLRATEPPPHAAPSLCEAPCISLHKGKCVPCPPSVFFNESRL